MRSDAVVPCATDGEVVLLSRWAEMCPSINTLGARERLRKGCSSTLVEGMGDCSVSGGFAGSHAAAAAPTNTG